VIGIAKERDEASAASTKPLPDRDRSKAETPAAPEEAPTIYKLAPATDIKGEALPPARRGRPSAPDKGEDRVYLPGRKDPVYLSRWPPALFLLQRIRDEAHRFAITYHRKVKEKEDLQSLLDRIPGIGASRKKALLTFFGDIWRIRAATVLDLQQVDGIGEETAGRIHNFFNFGK
jgi:excinuclease ABC subunit C